MPCIAKKTFERAAAGDVNLIAQVKANQPALHHAVAELCDATAPLDSARTADKNRRSREEARLVEVFSPGDAWPTPSGLAMSARSSASIATFSPAPPNRALARHQRDRLVCQRHRPASRGLCQGHPRPLEIENRSHYVRDGSFAEDASRIRCNPGIFARLRSFAANILRFNDVRNITDARHRIAFGGIGAILSMSVMN